MNAPLDPLATSAEADDDDLLNVGRLATDVRLTIFWPSDLARKPQHGHRVALTWGELVEWLGRPIVSDDKAGSGGYSLATFKDDARSLAGVEAVYALGLDIDTGDVSVNCVASMLGLHRCVAYSTHSSTSAHPRSRAIIALSRSVTATEYPAIWGHVDARLRSAGVVVDRSAKDPSRLWFSRVVRPGSSVEFAYHDGVPVDVDRVLALVAEHRGRVEHERKAPHQREGGGDRSRYERRAFELAIANVVRAGPGSRNQTLNNEAFALARLPGLSSYEIAAGLVAAAERAGLPRSEAARTVRSALGARRADTKPLPDKRPS